MRIAAQYSCQIWIPEILVVGVQCENQYCSGSSLALALAGSWAFARACQLLYLGDEMQIWIFLPPVNKKKSYWESQYSGTKLYNLTSEETFFKPNVLSTWLHFSNQSPQARESTSVFDLSLDRNKLIETVWSRPSCNLSHNLEWSNHIIVCTVPTPGLLVNKTKVLSKIDLKCVTYLQYMVFILYYSYDFK